VRERERTSCWEATICVVVACFPDRAPQGGGGTGITGPIGAAVSDMAPRSGGGGGAGMGEALRATAKRAAGSHSGLRRRGR
jgi:hypothetical protein